MRDLLSSFPKLFIEFYEPPSYHASVAEANDREEVSGQATAAGTVLNFPLISGGFCEFEGDRFIIIPSVEAHWGHDVSIITPQTVVSALWEGDGVFPALVLLCLARVDTAEQFVFVQTFDLRSKFQAVRSAGSSLPAQHPGEVVATTTGQLLDLGMIIGPAQLAFTLDSYHHLVALQGIEYAAGSQALPLAHLAPPFLCRSLLSVGNTGRQQLHLLSPLTREQHFFSRVYGSSSDALPCDGLRSLSSDASMAIDARSLLTKGVVERLSRVSVALLAHSFF